MMNDKEQVEKMNPGASLITKLPGSILGSCGPSAASSNKSTTLIPRNIITLVQVFPLLADIAMENRSQRRHHLRSGSPQAKGTPVVYGAIKNNDRELLQTILKQQPELMNKYDGEGRTPLSYAAYSGDVEMVKYLLKEFPKSIDKHDKDTKFAVHKASAGGHIEVLKVFHSLFPKSLLWVDRHGRSILHVAAKESGDRLRNVVSYLVGLGEISTKLVRMKDEDDHTPSYWAQKNGNHQIVRILNRDN